MERRLPGGWSGGFPPPPPQRQPKVRTTTPSATSSTTSRSRSSPIGAGSGLGSDSTVRAAGSRSSSRQDAGAPNRERPPPLTGAPASCRLDRRLPAASPAKPTPGNNLGRQEGLAQASEVRTTTL